MATAQEAYQQVSAFGKLLYDWLHITGNQATEKQVSSNSDIDTVVSNIQSMSGRVVATQLVTLAKSFLTSIKGTNVLIISVGVAVLANRNIEIRTHNLIGDLLGTINISLILSVGI